jgi:hypothetical protein
MIGKFVIFGDSYSTHRDYIDKDFGHPTPLGMQQIASQVKTQLS